MASALQYSARRARWDRLVSLGDRQLRSNHRNQLKSWDCAARSALQSPFSRYVLYHSAVVVTRHPCGALSSTANGIYRKPFLRSTGGQP